LENSLIPIRNNSPLTVEGGWQRSDISLVEIWTIIRKRKWVIAGCLGVSLTLAAVYCIKSPRRYEATARVVVNPDTVNPLGMAGDEANRVADPALMQETQVRIMQSDTVAWDVIRQLRLDKNPNFLPAKSGEQAESPEDISPARRFVLMTEFHRRLTVTSVPKTALVELRFRSRNPKLAADIVTATANAYLERNFRTHFNANMQVSDWLSKELDDLRKKVESSQQEFVDFQRKNGIIGTDETHNIVISPTR
jgi:succinoglycan biosynthesis transport protein ExoP